MNIFPGFPPRFARAFSGGFAEIRETTAGPMSRNALVSPGKMVPPE